jgi:hypothetical protein
VSHRPHRARRSRDRVPGLSRAAGLGRLPRRGPARRPGRPASDAARTEALRARFPGLAVVIWTTTPWTLPANLFVMADPTFEYVRARRRRALPARRRARADAVREASGARCPKWPA